MRYAKNTFFFLLFSILTLHSMAQNMNSPYSVYGIGDIDTKTYNRTSGMAGTGLATKSSVFLIDNNPASISGLIRSFYIMNIAITGKASQYSGDPVNSTNSSNKDLWVKGIILGVKINNFWASSIGFNQFSNVNYVLNGSKFIEGTNTSLTTTYTGDGGLNKYYWNNAFSLGKHFSVGVKSSVIAGSVNQTETLVEETTSNVIQTKQQDYYGHLHFEYGAIYNTSLNKKWDLALGGKFSNKTNMPYNRSITVTENSSIIVNDKYLKTNQFYLPVSLGGGLSLTHNKKSTFAADYIHEDWSSLNISGTGWQLINSDRVSIGTQISKFQNAFGQNFEKNFWQFGAFAKSSYLSVRNHNINDYGISFGYGGLLKGGLLYSLSGEFGTRGTTSASLIRENYFQFTIGLSYRDFLVSKGRKYE
ncbi:MAG: hypothetical protein JSU05_03285 [Bacteroidetes bacterium]|nr:hypothetical protein [Bacteroidota bacterium]